MRIHIDRLVLAGFDYSPREAADLESALSKELTHRLNRSGLSQELLRGETVDAIKTASVSLPQTPSPTQSGRAIARAVHGGLAK